jgi:DNA replication protein DnaC
MTTETIKTLHNLKLPGMAKSWEAMSETHQLDKMSLRDGFEMLLQAECDNRMESRIKRLIANSHMRQHAAIEKLETDTARGLSSASVSELAAGEYIEHGMTIIITGAAGTGKSYFACALGDRACRQGRKVLYFTMNMLAESLRLVRMEGRQTNFFKKLSRCDLLIIDDFGMKKLDGELQNDFEQIIDDRYASKAIILSSQLPVADWYGLFQSEMIAEACLDRLVHKAIRFELKGDSLRKNINFASVSLYHRNTCPYMERNLHYIYYYPLF